MTNNSSVGLRIGNHGPAVFSSDKHIIMLTKCHSSMAITGRSISVVSIGSECSLDCYSLCQNDVCYVCHEGHCEQPPKQAFNECETCDETYGFCHTVNTTAGYVSSCVAFSKLGSACLTDDQCSSNLVCGKRMVCETNATKTSRPTEIPTVNTPMSYDLNQPQPFPQLWWILASVCSAIFTTILILFLVWKYCLRGKVSVATQNSGVAGLGRGEERLRGMDYVYLFRRQQQHQEPLPQYLEREELPPKYEEILDIPQPLERIEEENIDNEPASPTADTSTTPGPISCTTHPSQTTQLNN
ncbi:uncharacterized protein VTP21DRAFT_548 [Calcarisporiella thermophila]|uniref:uncharacterized protein n=1 Tax=Calcarisporiella thermophila TaxID=911321 RepID=UPI00374450AF